MTEKRVNGVNWRIRDDVMKAIRQHTKYIGALQYRWVEQALIEKLQSEGVKIDKLPELTTPEVMEVDEDEVEDIDGFEIIDDVHTDLTVEENMSLHLDDDFIYGSD